MNVWQTTIYPGDGEKLPLHRHEHNRVLVALEDGELKIVNDKSEMKTLTLSKNKAYFLEKDVLGEKHTDVNTTGHPIRVMVIELKD